MIYICNFKHMSEDSVEMTLIQSSVYK